MIDDNQNNDNIIKFPNSDELINETFDVEPVTENVEVTVVDKNEDKSVEEIIDELAQFEVRRMSNNIDFLNDVETNLKSQIRVLMESGAINIDTLMDVMDAFGKSIDRSNKILKDKSSPLLNVLIDNRTQVNGENVVVNDSDEIQADQLSQSSRKKLTNLLTALLASKDDEGEEENNED